MKLQSKRASTLLLASMVFGICMPKAYSAEVARSFSQPIPNPQVTYDFGNFDDSYYWGRHLAQDYRARPGTPVFAIANGEIKYSGNVTGLGHAIHIEHTLPDGSQVVSVYYHMKRLGQGGITASGDAIRGQTIGYVTGVAADYGIGPHLHLGIRKGAYRSGTDTRTEKWFYPGYSSIFSDGVRNKNEANPLHATIAGEWEGDPKAFIEGLRPPPGGPKVVNFDQFPAGTGNTNSAVNSQQVGDLVGENIVATYVGSPNPQPGTPGLVFSIESAGFFPNGDWRAPKTFVNLNCAVAPCTMRFDFNDGPVHSVSAFVNYSPGSATDDMIIQAIGLQGQVLETLNVSQTAPISNPGSINEGAVRGISRPTADIAAITFSNAFVGVDNFTFAR